MKKTIMKKFGLTLLLAMSFNFAEAREFLSGIVSMKVKYADLVQGTSIVSQVAFLDQFADDGTTCLVKYASKIAGNCTVRPLPEVDIYDITLTKENLVSLLKWHVASSGDSKSEYAITFLSQPSVHCASSDYSDSPNGAMIFQSKADPHLRWQTQSYRWDCQSEVDKTKTVHMTFDTSFLYSL